MKRPMDGKYSYTGSSMSGDYPCIWITVEGTYNRISASEARKIANKLLHQAEWFELERSKGKARQS